MAVKHKAPAHHKPKPVTHKKKKKLTNAQRAVKEIYPNEKAKYKAIPAEKRGPGKLTGGHTVQLQAWAAQLSVTCLLGANGAKLTGGYGTWTAIAVPRSDPLTQWAGRGLYTMDLDLMVDGWHRQASVEPTLKKIEALATRLPASLTPPALRIYGAVPHPELKWVITGIDYGDFIRLFHSGARCRQELTLHLMEYREETDLEKLPRASATAKSPRHYRVKKGDTLKTIAAKLLGKATDWPKIAKLNKGLRGFKIPTKFIGKTILVPQKGDNPKDNVNDGSKSKAKTKAH